MRPWIKLFREDLSDVMIGTLSDRLYRRYHECYRLAAKIDDDGLLPSVWEIAYEVRAPELELIGELSELVDVGLLSKDGPAIFITRWKNEQPKYSDNNRQFKHRHAPVTKVSRDNLSKEVEVEVEVEVEEKKKTKATPSRRASPVPPPPSCQTFRQTAHRYPPKALYNEIASTVGDTPESLELWGKVILAWVGLGWNPMNVAGMLDCFKRKEIPKMERPSRDGRVTVMPKLPDNYEPFVSPRDRVYPDDRPKTS